MPNEASSEEIAVELCCDALGKALDGGGIQVAELAPGEPREVIVDDAGEQAIAINYCPFCGAPRGPIGAIDEDDER
jgi:hypothetical protein